MDTTLNNETLKQYAIEFFNDKENIELLQDNKFEVLLDKALDDGVRAYCAVVNTLLRSNLFSGIKFENGSVSIIIPEVLYHRAIANRLSDGVRSTEDTLLQVLEGKQPFNYNVDVEDILAILPSDLENKIYDKSINMFKITDQQKQTIIDQVNKALNEYILEAIDELINNNLFETETGFRHYNADIKLAGNKAKTVTATLPESDFMKLVEYLLNHEDYDRALLDIKNYGEIIIWGLLNTAAPIKEPYRGWANLVEFEINVRDDAIDAVEDVLNKRIP